MAEAPHRPWKGITAEDRVQERRRRLLAAGRSVLATRGSRGATIVQVCDDAGLNKRYFYESFVDLDAFLDAVIADGTEEVGRRIRAALDDRGPDEDPLLVALATFVDTLLEDPDLLRVILVEPLTDPSRHRAQEQSLLQQLGLNLLLEVSGFDPGIYEEDELAVILHALTGTISQIAIAWSDGTLTVSRERFISLLGAAVNRQLGVAPR